MGTLRSRYSDKVLEDGRHLSRELKEEVARSLLAIVCDACTKKAFGILARRLAEITYPKKPEPESEPKRPDDIPF